MDLLNSQLIGIVALPCFVFLWATLTFVHLGPVPSTARDTTALLRLVRSSEPTGHGRPAPPRIPQLPDMQRIKQLAQNIGWDAIAADYPDTRAPHDAPAEATAAWRRKVTGELGIMTTRQLWRGASTAVFLWDAYHPHDSRWSPRKDYTHACGFGHISAIYLFNDILS
eukprot:SAG31_NODE_2129_length_6388_cov_3.199396_2_plen_168_part_00